MPVLIQYLKLQQGFEGNFLPRFLACLKRFAGQPVEQSGVVRRSQGWQVNVAADHSGSKPEAHKRRGKWGYHPLEELTKHEREAMQAGNGRPSDADIARTITEVTFRCSLSHAPLIALRNQS